MVTQLLHRVVARPLVYDLVQLAVGAKAVRARVAKKIAGVRSAKLVLDVGGGTGAVGAMWDRRTTYVCLDIDAQKFDGFRERNPRGVPLLGDATRLPIADRSLDVVLCNSVTHHLDDALFPRMIAEAARVLRASGRMILTDAIWQPNRAAGCLLWKYDRGSFPRPGAALRQAVDRHFAVKTWERFAVWHEYFICVAGPRV